MGNITVSANGMADDTVLISNDIFHLLMLLELTEYFCHKYGVSLVPEKTILQCLKPKSYQDDDEFNPIKINDHPIPFSSMAEHVGIVRSPNGNETAILSRITAHKSALNSVLHTGMAREHRGNPAVGIKVNQLYGLPVLLSGLAVLLLNDQDINLIEKTYCETLRRLMSLNDKTPHPVIYFLSGSLPGSFLLHMRQLTLFGMITRLKDNILHRHAFNILNFVTMNKSSWFDQIRRWCLMYSLPHP